MSLFQTPALQTSPSSSFNAGGPESAINKKKLAKAAGKFYSNVSVKVSESVYDPSLDGLNLDDEETEWISKWIPPPPSLPPASGEIRPAGAQTVMPETYNTISIDSESEDEVDHDLAQKLEELAISSFNNGDYERAEVFFLKLLPPQNRHILASEVSLMFALSLAALGKWEVIDQPLARLAKAPPPILHPLLCHLFHAAALHCLSQAQNYQAFAYCRRAMRGKRKLPDGKSSPSYAKSLHLLWKVYETMGDLAGAEGCRALLPADLRTRQAVESPKTYVNWAAALEKNDGERTPRAAPPSTILPRPARPPPVRINPQHAERSISSQPRNDTPEKPISKLSPPRLARTLELKQAAEFSPNSYPRTQPSPTPAPIKPGSLPHTVLVLVIQVSTIPYGRISCAYSISRCGERFLETETYTLWPWKGSGEGYAEVDPEFDIFLVMAQC